jgi:DUF4097 and DUF4098 domain-containing protein YvlB
VAVRRVALAVTLVALAPARAGAEPERRVQRDVVDVSPPAGIAVERVTIDNRYGDVIVIGHDRDQVAIEAVKHAPDADALDRLKVQLVPDPAGAVSVTAVIKADGHERPLPSGAVGIDLVVRVPHAAHLTAAVWKGRVDVRGLDRGAALVADHGEITVHAVSGAIDAETSFGSQRFEDVLGSVEARAVEGDLRVERLRGDRLVATVWKGRIEVRRAAVRELALDLAHGDIAIDLDLRPGGSYRVAAARGDVSVRIARKAPVELRLRGKRISVPRRLRSPRDVSAGTLVGTLGTGPRPALLDVSSSAGAITVAEF